MTSRLGTGKSPTFPDLGVRASDLGSRILVPDLGSGIQQQQIEDAINTFVVLPFFTAINFTLFIIFNSFQQEQKKDLSFDKEFK
jgi:hypothetical protein